jgi:predicted amidohydrolase
VAASCFEPDGAHDLRRRREALRVHVAEMLAEVRPDFAVLPEVVVATGLGHKAAEPLGAGTVPSMAKLAAEFKVNLCVPIIENHGGRLYNTAVYLDRSGSCAGFYRKRVLTRAELEGGLRPGAAEQPPVVLDGLRLGTAICFDANFPDQIWKWTEAGVDLLVFPAYTFAGELVRAWAINCAVPLVCAFPWESVIYERDGSVLAKAGGLTTTVQFGHHPRWIAATVSFRSRVYHLDGNQERMKELCARYGALVDVRTMERDGRFMVTVRGGDVDLDDLERRLGLTPLQTYLRAARAANRRACS